jgi:hypothetical protein
MTTSGRRIETDRATISLPPHFAHIGASNFHTRESVYLNGAGFRIRHWQVPARGMERA